MLSCYGNLGKGKQDYQEYSYRLGCGIRYDVHRTRNDRRVRNNFYLSQSLAASSCGIVLYLAWYSCSCCQRPFYAPTSLEPVEQSVCLNPYNVSPLLKGCPLLRKAYNQGCYGGCNGPLSRSKCYTVGYVGVRVLYTFRTDLSSFSDPQSLSSAVMYSGGSSRMPSWLHSSAKQSMSLVISAVSYVLDP